MRPHEQAPLTLMRRAAGLRPEQPLFDSLAGFEGYELTDRLHRDDARWASREAILEARTELPLTLQLYRSPNWDFVLTYDPCRFPGENARWMAGRFRTALESLLIGVDLTVGELDVISGVEREQILSWGIRKDPYPHDETVHGRFSRVARQDPERVALVFADQTWTYAELEGRSNELAARLAREAKVESGLVAIIGPRCPEQIMAILAVLKAGGAYLPLDPEFPDERLSLLIDESGAACLVTCGGWAATGRGLGLPCFEATRAGRVLTHPPVSSAGPDSPAYVMFTSGSTGRPKGVEVPHRGILRLLFGIDYIELSRDTSLIHLSPAAFDASTFEIWGALLLGGRCVLYPDRVPTPEILGELIRRYNVDTLWLTCSLFNFMVDEAVETFAPIRQLLTGGEALSRDHVERALNLLPNTNLINCYGPTEATTFASTYRLPASYRAADGPVPIGRPISNTSLVVVGPGDLPAPIGCEGELMIGGPGVALGYRDRPDLTEEKFVQIPGFPEEIFYRTGDRVLWRSDGILAFVGRVDDQIKIRGFRIELGEVETELRKVEGIQRAAVVMVDQPPRGKFLAAAVVPSAGVRTDADQVRRRLARSVPDFLVPATIRVVDELPLNPNGKIDRKQLTERLLAPAREGLSLSPSDGTEDDLIDGIQERLLPVFCEVLRIDRIDASRSFISQGGDSLLALRLAAKAAEELNQQLPPSQLLDGRSINEVIRSWHRLGRSGISSGRIELESVDRFSLWPLGSKQAHYVAKVQAHPGEPVSVLGRAFLVKGSLDRTALQEAVNLVVRQQEPLRTILVPSGDGSWAQKVLPDLEPRVDWGSLSGSGSMENQGLVALEQFVREGLDAFSGPILKLQVLEVSATRWVLLVKVLHIAVDGGTLPDLFAAISRTYNGVLAGQQIDSPRAERQFLDFQLWYRKVSERKHEEASEVFWRDYLRDALPIRFPGFPEALPGFRVSQGRIRYLDFPRDLARRIREHARSEGVTSYSLGFAVYVGLLKLYSGQNDFLVGTSINLREDPRFDGMIGDFSNPIVARFTLSEPLSLKGVLEMVTESLGLVMDHRFFPALEIRKLVPMGESNLEDPINGFIFSEMRDICEGFDLSGTQVRHLEGQTRLLLALMSTNFLDSGRAMRLRISYAPEIFDEETIDCFCSDFLRLADLFVGSSGLPLVGFRPSWPKATGLALPDALAGSSSIEIGDVEGEVLSVVRELIANVLDLDHVPERVSLFDLGGDSVSALRILRRIRRRFGLEIEYLQLTGDPTPVGLARAIVCSPHGRQVADYPPIEVSPVRDPVFLTDQQVENLKVALSRPIQKGGGITRAFRVAGRFDDQAYERAINHVLNRHESLRLRTHFLEDGRISRDYREGARVDLKREDLRDLPLAVLDDRIRLIYKETALTGLPPPVDPAYAFQVIRLPGDETLLLITISHGVTDGMGLVRLFSELGTAYRAYAVGSEPRLPAVNLQAYDFEKWLEVWREKNRPRLEKFWNQVFAEGVPKQSLPFDLTEEIEDTCVGRYLYLDLPTEVMDAVRDLAEKVGTTQYFVLLAAFLVLINRATGVERPFASIVADARIHHEAETVVGNFINAVPVVARLQDDTRLINAVCDIAKAGSQALAHAGLPVGPLLKTIDQKSALGSGQLGQIAFNQVPNTYSALDLGGLRVEGLRRTHVWRKNSISFLVFDNEDGSATAQFSYPTEQMSETRAEAFVARYRRIIEAVVEAPDCELGELGDMTERVAASQREKVLTSFFSEVLGRTVQRNESFFDHGGDSLTALRLIQKVRAVSSVALSYQDLYSYQTPGDLGVYLDAREKEIGEKGGDVVSPLRRLSRKRSWPATDNQLVYWRLVTESEGKTTGNIVRPLRVRGSFDPRLFRRAVRAVIERHEALRTGLVADDQGKVFQHIKTRFRVPFSLEKKAGLTERSRSAFCVRTADQEGKEPFDLAKPPLMRVKIYRFDREDFYLMITVNHAVTDGTSLGIIWNDLAQAYRALGEGREPGLIPPRYQYLDVSAWQRRVLYEGKEDDLRRFWEETLVGMDREIRLPLDGRVGRRRARPGFILEHRFEPALTARLRLLCQRHGFSLYCLSLASFKLVLRALSGADDISVSSAVDCREHPDAHEVVGHFANRVIVRSRVDDSMSLVEFIEQVSANLSRALDHRQYPSRRALELVPTNKNGRRMPDDTACD
ncbi:MAG: hypothetical protein DRP71_15840, partial [Verrucomicrobia bacterium]